MDHCFIPFYGYGKESACKVGDLGSISGSGKSPGEGNANPLQYSYLENPMDRAAWWATVHEVTKSQAELLVSQTNTFSTSLWAVQYFAYETGRFHLKSLLGAGNCGEGMI